MSNEAHENLFWALAASLSEDDPRVIESTIMNGPCLRVGDEFLALVDFKGSGMVVKLPRERVAELIEEGVARSFAPAGRVFKEWASILEADEALWASLLREGVEFVGRPAKKARKKPTKKAKKKAKTSRKR